MTSNTYAILAILPVVAYFAYTALYNWRFKNFKDIPQLPRSLLLGHLPHIASGFKKFGDARRHIGIYLLPLTYVE